MADTTDDAAQRDLEDWFEKKTLEVAKAAVDAWHEKRAFHVRAAYESGHNVNTLARCLSEARDAARRLRVTLTDPDITADAIFRQQANIFIEQEERGYTKQWVAAYWEIRCIATGYMLLVLRLDDLAKEFTRQFLAYVAENESIAIAEISNAAPPAPVRTAASGWYADPAGQDQLRWWDGTQWTDHFARHAE